MTTHAWSDIYQQATEGPQVIAAGTYDVDVIAARPSGGNTIWLDLRVSGGALNGQATTVSIWVPPEEDSGTNRIYPFTRRIVGFGDLSPLFAAMDDAGDRETALDILADALVGRRVSATLTVQGEDAGKYAGMQQLDSTKPADGPPAPTPASQPEPVEQAALPVEPDGEAARIAALEAELAAARAGGNGRAEAPEPVLEVPQAVTATAGEDPF